MFFLGGNRGKEAGIGSEDTLMYVEVHGRGGGGVAAIESKLGMIEEGSVYITTYKEPNLPMSNSPPSPQAHSYLQLPHHFSRPADQGSEKKKYCLRIY